MWIKYGMIRQYIVAQSAAPQSPGLLSMLVPMVLMFIIMYVILIKPQQRKQKQHEEMIKKLKSGDKVVTNGGIHGTIAAVKDHTVLVKIADNVKIEVNRASISEHRTGDISKTT